VTPLRCPSCRGSLIASAEAWTCPRCERCYPLEEGIADFSGGLYYDAFDPSVELSAESRRGLELEFEGTRRRILHYYEPRLRETHARRVLDCGTGNGLAVDLLNERGFDAWGADLSALRKHQWRERSRRDRLTVADVASLPFADASFDAVIASGLLEHIGVEERRVPGYEVRPLADRDARRLRVVRELLRVTTSDGVLYLDFPNGAFPIDFWHGDQPGEARWHALSEGFLPRFAELTALDPALRVRALSPYGRLQFVQAAAHWWGRAFSVPVAAFFRLMRIPGFRWLARTALNPFLVLEVRRS